MFHTPGLTWLNHRSIWPFPVMGDTPRHLLLSTDHMTALSSRNLVSCLIWSFHLFHHVFLRPQKSPLQVILIKNCAWHMTDVSKPLESSVTLYNANPIFQVLYINANPIFQEHMQMFWLHICKCVWINFQIIIGWAVCIYKALVIVCGKENVCVRVCVSACMHVWYIYTYIYIYIHNFNIYKLYVYMQPHTHIHSEYKVINYKTRWTTCTKYPYNFIVYIIHNLNIILYKVSNFKHAE